MTEDQLLIDQIINIRSSSNIKTTEFLKLLVCINPSEAKIILTKIHKLDKKIEILSELLHMEKNRTDKDILDEIEKIRSQNNTLWMDVVRLCFELDPIRSRKIFYKIKECDKKINKLSRELSSNEETV